MIDFIGLKDLLETRLKVIADAELRQNDPERQLAMLEEVSHGIDDWREKYRKEIDKRLLHFLEHYSLDKALAFIKEGQMKCR
jgi:hypothetical protein